MSLALVGPNTARGGAVLAALEPIAGAIELTGLSAQAPGARFEWRGDQPVGVLGDADLSAFEAIVSAEPIALPAGAAPCLTLTPDDAPILGETLAARQRIADPIAAAVARVLAPLQSRVSGVGLTVLTTASAHGRPGMDELRDQTVALLNFRPLPTTVFDRRLAFDLLFESDGRAAAIANDLAFLCPEAPRADVSRVTVPAFMGAAVEVRLHGAVDCAAVRAQLEAVGFAAGAGLADATDAGGVLAQPPVATADGVRLWLMLDDLQWGVGAVALDFLARIRASTV